MSFLINKKGLELISTKELYEKSKGSLFEDKLLSEFNKIYSKEDVERIKTLSYEEYIQHINQNEQSTTEDYINSLKENLTKDFSIINKNQYGTLIYQRKVNIKCTYKHLFNLLDITMNDFINTLLKTYIDYVSKCKTRYTISYKNDVLTIGYKLDKTISNKEMLDMLCDQLYQCMEDVLQKVFNEKEIDYYNHFKTDLNKDANNIYIAFMEYLKIQYSTDNRTFFNKLIKNTLTPSLSKCFISQDKESLLEYLYKYKKFRPNSEEKKANELLEEYNIIKNRYEKILNKGRISISFKNDKICFSKHLSYSIDELKNIDLSIFNNEKDKIDFLITLIQSKISYYCKLKFSSCFNMEIFKSTFKYDDCNHKITCTVDFFYDSAYDNFNINDVIDYLNSLYFKTTLV